MAKINFLSLGGQDERGKSCFVLEVNDDIFIFNAGAKIPTSDVFGVNMIVCDYSYLEKNAKRVKGIFIGTPTFNNVMGIKLLLAQVGYKIPIYTSPIGAIVVKKIFEQKVNNKKIEPNIIELDPISDKKIGSIYVTAFKVSNSMPHSYGFVLKTSDGAIVYIDEFIISNDKNKTFDSQINALNNITKNNTLALIVGMGQAGNPCFTAPNHKNKGFYESILQNTKNRLIVGCYSNDAYSIFTLATIAKQQNRPFIVYSNNFINTFVGVLKLKLFNSKNLISLPVSEINNSKNAIIVVIENQDTLFPRLNKILHNEDKHITLTSEDQLVLGVVITPGFEMLAAQLSDEVGRLDIPYKALPKTVLPMTQSDEDLKHLINFLQPKYLIPINGLYKTEVKFTSTVTTSWIKSDQIISISNGELFSIEDKVLNPKPQVIELEDKYISSFDALDVGANILFERAQMGENGVINLIVIFDKQFQKLFNYVEFDYCGVVNDDSQVRAQVKEIEETFKKRMGECLVYDDRKRLVLKDTKASLKRLLTKLFEKKFNKRPLVLPTVVDCYKTK
ncbi:ribonuclease J [Ureaplasma urealyticum]|uniref:Ribonuclease J n=1 Tax=Ureaplasma urealyticum TaxID=2130 RepID=A0AAX1QWS0_UREUR|nr:ribonuclease J [Ureaplasma urealyticum]RCJ00555.1 ribonuclease J [Ureaplasma urealyticum]